MWWRGAPPPAASAGRYSGAGGRAGHQRLPALNLGRVKARVDASRALEEEAKAQYQQTVLRAMQEAEASLVGYAKARTRLARLQDAASATERAADYARVRFEGGVADFLEVLDA